MRGGKMLCRRAHSVGRGFRHMSFIRPVIASVPASRGHNRRAKVAARGRKIYETLALSQEKHLI